MINTLENEGYETQENAKVGHLIAPIFIPKANTAVWIIANGDAPPRKSIVSIFAETLKTLAKGAKIVLINVEEFDGDVSTARIVK